MKTRAPSSAPPANEKQSWRRKTCAWSGSDIGPGVLFMAAPLKRKLACPPAAMGDIRIVFATNAAESSITLTGTDIVIDCGLVNTTSFDPELGLFTYAVVPCSRAEIRQRSGRVGRERDGTVYRLFSENWYNSRQEYPDPEIRKGSLEGLLLRTMETKMTTHHSRLPFLTEPGPAWDLAFARSIAFEVYHAPTGKITSLGRRNGKLALPIGVGRVYLAIGSVY